MPYASTEKNGAARDEALKRRNGGTVREVLRLKPLPKGQTENPPEPKGAAKQPAEGENTSE
jgi:hypothetical protein